MSSIINTGTNPKALRPGVMHWWGVFYNDRKDEYKYLYETESSERSYEEDVQTVTFGLAPVKPEGSSIKYDTETQGFVNRSTHVAYGIGYIVTREEIKDNLYDKLAKRRTQSLARSMNQTKEIVGVNLYNRAFSGSYTRYDGVSLINASHPTQSGNQSNTLSAAADLSEASLEDLSISIRKAQDDRGLRVNLNNKSLIVPPDLEFEACRILKSYLQNYTANNAVNALMTLGKFPEGVKVNTYLTDTSAYFIRTDTPGLVHYEREGIEFTQDNDFDTENFKAKAYERYSFTCYDWRSLYGSEGI